MRELVIGTAGHVDHGKTTLVKALTGVDTDRLPEERDRGMSIELGFAPLRLPSGRVLGLVDVPGHERFIKHMLAGASGMDMVLLIIAADEGVMQQTREHVDIVSLLGIKHGIIVITKSDMVEEDWLDMVMEDVRAELSGSPLAFSPIIPVSSVTGQGIQALTAAIEDMASKVEDTMTLGFTRLPIDRAFSMPGHGTVVTGTLAGGVVRPQDRLEILPAGREVRVRQVQVHEVEVAQATKGQRVALNLSGVDRDEIERGMVIATPNMIEPTSLIDASLALLEKADPIEHNERVRVHLGTAEVLGRIRVIGQDMALPGDTTLVQIELEQAVAAVRGDKFVVRTYSPIHTVGGGTVLYHLPERRKRMSTKSRDELAMLHSGTMDEVIPLIAHSLGLKSGGWKAVCPVTITDISKGLGMPAIDLEPVLAKGLPDLVAFGDGSGAWYMRKDDHGEALSAAVDSLSDFHRANPLRKGMPREELRSRTAQAWDPRAFSAFLAHACSGADLVEGGAYVALPNHEVILGAFDRAAARDMESAYLSSLFAPPELKEGGPVFDYLIDQGILLRIGPDLVFHKDAVDQAVLQVLSLASGDNGFAVGDFKDALGTTRKYAVALLEYFDGLGLTRRVQDRRVAGRNWASFRNR